MTVLPVEAHRDVPAFWSPRSEPVLGSTTQVMSVRDEPEPSEIESRSVVVFPFPNAMAAVSFTYFSFPLTVFLVSFKRVPNGLGDVVVAFKMAAAFCLVTLTSERTPPSGASQPRTIGSTVLLLIVTDRGCEKDGIKRWKGVV